MHNLQRSAKKMVTRLREISSCSCLTTLPDPAWVLLSKVCIHFTRVLQNYKHLCIQHKNIWLINPYWEHLKAAHDARIQTLESAFFIPPYRCYIRNYDDGDFTYMMAGGAMEKAASFKALSASFLPSRILKAWQRDHTLLCCTAVARCWPITVQSTLLFQNGIGSRV